ncbi:MAG: DUF2007 domain-containing protein [Chlorobi bacterium]|nr:DUF2007 domain-containing protein [Chlorobiota bacterium]
MSNWITIITFILPHEAQIAKGRLESEGINTIIQNELTTQVNNFYSNAIGGVKLLINENDKEKAEQILIDGGFIIKSGHRKIEKVNEKFLEIDKCPYCGSKNYSKKKTPGLLLIISLLLFWIPIPIFRKSYYCFNCEREWKN